jgi:DNA-binding MurR/RpiR family transcriptional regulator
MTSARDDGTGPGGDGSPSLERRIRSHYGTLPESERRIADLILEFPGEIAAYSATELRADVFDQIVDAICKSRRVFLLGYRNSHYLAGYARWQIIQVRTDVHLLPEAGSTIAEGIAGVTGQDILIVIGFRRRVPEVLRAMSAARAAGAKVLYVTDWSAEAASDATWILPCAVHGNDLFDRYAAAISLLHFLCVAVVDRLAAKGRGHLQRVESLHESLHDFD